MHLLSWKLNGPGGSHRKKNKKSMQREGKGDWWANFLDCARREVTLVDHQRKEGERGVRPRKDTLTGGAEK